MPRLKKQSKVVSESYFEKFINEKLAAKYLSVSPRTLQAHRLSGGWPRWVALSRRCIRYRRCDLRDWALLRSATSTAEYNQHTASSGKDGEA